MADSVTLSVVSNLLGRITDLLISEVNFLRDVSEQVRNLQDELQWIHGFLKDADVVRQKEGDERLRVWVSQFRDISYDAEDAIDTFILKLQSARNREGFRGFLKRAVGIFNESKPIYLFKLEIDAINTRISKIRERLPSYGVQNISGSSMGNGRPRQVTRRYAHEEEDVVGLDEDISKLVAELTNKEGYARVVSAVGIGGSGKTTLARKLYNHVDVKKHFDCHVWVSVSQEWQARDLLINIITQTTSPFKEERELIGKMTNDELVIKVYNFLKEKRYLVVLDDIWEREAWDDLRPAFPSANAGSKLIITSRIRDVALHADPHCFVQEPRPLTDEEAWELLFKKVKGVIGDDRREEASRFHQLGKEMVKKCSGLPLAIVVLGGLLATKTSLEEWQKVSQNIGLQLRKAGKGGPGQQGVLNVLALSYDNLPYHLKPCFLYLAVFPEDLEIRVKPLIRMWIAEGFISSSQIDREQSLEDAGEECLHELIQRSMIQVGAKYTTGRVKSCLMHDQLREMCLEKAREENFLEVLPISKSSVATASQGSASKARRIALHLGNDADSSMCSLLELKNSGVRSLLCFGSALKLSNSEWITVCTNFPLIRVLHLQQNYFDIQSLPKEIGNLFHLKYLGLVNCDPQNIPQSFGNLWSLQTLYIRDSLYPVRVGEVVQKMEQLRYLGYNGSIIASRDFGVGGLKNLRCLRLVQAGDWMARDLPHLTNLQHLAILDIKTAEQVKAVLGSPCIALDRIRSLGLHLSDSLLEFENLELSGCRNLSKLYLWGKIPEKKVHLRQQLPPNLAKLILVCSQMKEQDPMAAVEKLPFLKFLLLGKSSYTRSQMTCSANGFPRLQHLEICGLNDLEDWRIEKGAMPLLTHLKIENCQELRMIPEGLKFITTLQELDIRGMPQKFKNRLRKVDETDFEAKSDPHQGVDHHKIHHIPLVII
ncbi:NB-ARC [Dillenia turbinata]|uniref:NB-ARC n=1 Tax=Dillenia turbinata TaxID=194707 RepID=A0AAN8Z0V5_9MAGN